MDYWFLASISYNVTLTLIFLGIIWNKRKEIKRIFLGEIEWWKELEYNKEWRP